MKRLLDVDPDSGAQEWFHYDETTDNWAVQRVENVGAQLDANKRAHLHTDGWNKARDMRHVASIPIGIMYEWATKYGVRAWDKNHAEGVRRLLNSNEYRYLRTQDIII